MKEGGKEVLPELFRRLTFCPPNRAMFEKTYAEGDIIIRQGDEGDNFYVISSGECNIYVDGAKSEENPTGLVLKVKEGDSFGELALMYDSPRAATVVACAVANNTDCTYSHSLFYS